MDIRSTFRNRLSRAMGGRSEVGQPAIGCAGVKRVGVEALREIRGLSRGAMTSLKA